MLIPVDWLRTFLDLPEDAEAIAERLTTTGNEIEEIRDEGYGPVFHLKLTPNRPDMLGVEGAARELGALFGRPITPVPNGPDLQPAALPPVSVSVEDSERCPRYVGITIRGVKVGPSPAWLRRRVESAGMRSISNVVDVTNFVMWELGQPLHAFDLSRLLESRIVVRRAVADERLVLIDGAEATLSPDDLVIADGGRAIALAGVMGGRESEVSDETVDVFLEAACFAPTAIRRTRKRAGVPTAASYRFERGVDPHGVLRAAIRAAGLIVETAGGAIDGGFTDHYPYPPTARQIPFRPDRCSSLLGIRVGPSEAEIYLTSIGCEIERGADRWLVSAPSRRPDLQIEEDLIEEVGRLYGYDRLPETLPTGSTGAGALSPLERFNRQVRVLLTSQGLFEIVGNTLTSRTSLEASRLSRSPAWDEPRFEVVALRNPLSDDLELLRPSLLPGLFALAQHNLRRGLGDVFLYEVGRGHMRDGAAEPEEHVLVSGLICGNRLSHSWNAGRDRADFYTARGAVEALMTGLACPRAEFTRADHPAFHPGRSAWIKSGATSFGIVGEIHPDVAAAWDLPADVYAFEVDAEFLMGSADGDRRYAPPSRFPLALRDLAFLVNTDTPAESLCRVFVEELGDWCRGARLFDVYDGKSLPPGKVSLGFALQIGSDDRTLTDVEVEARLRSVIERVGREFGAELRG